MPIKSPTEELDGCDYLFLAAISEPEENGLRIVVQEGLRAGETYDLKVGSGTIEGIVPIEVTEESRTFEICWPQYITYSIRNESYCTWDKDEEWTGLAFRVYTRSKFLDFVTTATFASPDYPGPFKHYEILCANHIIDVAAQETPVVTVVGA